MNQNKFEELRAKQAELTAMSDQEARRQADLTLFTAQEIRLETSLRDALRDPRSTWASVSKLEQELDTMRRKVADTEALYDPVACEALAALANDVAASVDELSGIAPVDTKATK